MSCLLEGGLACRWAWPAAAPGAGRRPWKGCPAGLIRTAWVTLGSNSTPMPTAGTTDGATQPPAVKVYFRPLLAVKQPGVPPGPGKVLILPIISVQPFEHWLRFKPSLENHYVLILQLVVAPHSFAHISQAGCAIHLSITQLLVINL